MRDLGQTFRPYACRYLEISENNENKVIIAFKASGKANDTLSTNEKKTSSINDSTNGILSPLLLLLSLGGSADKL